MPGLMNGSKKARNISSVTNKISIYGDLGGLVTTVGRRSSNRSAIRNKGTNNIVMPVPGLGPAGDVTIAGVVVPPPANSGTTGRAYMMGQNPTRRYMMSRNPACSGGVGRRPVYVCNNTDSKLSQLGSSAITGYLFMTTGALAAAITLWDADRAGALATYGEINTWDVSNITDMSELFKSNTIFNSDISGWNVSNVLDMSEMFDDASAFNQDISSWDVSSVQNMAGMFAGATNFNNGLAAGASGTMSWQGNTGDVESMKNMFNSATAFNQDISSWNTTLVQDMSLMFAGATSFNNSNNPSALQSWANNLSAILNMENMFNAAVGFGITGVEDAQGIRSWQIPSGTPVNNMFANMTGSNYLYLNNLTNGTVTWVLGGGAPISSLGVAPTPPIGAAPGYDDGSSYFDVQ